MKILYFILAASMVLALGLLHVDVDLQPTLAQSSSTSPSSPSVHIMKDETNSYVVSSELVSVGTFDTSYSILGSVDSIIASKDLIRSTIVGDYESSPTIGYVKVPMDVPPGASPFADEATINQTMTAEIDKAIELAEESSTTSTNIKCDFGMELAEWKCTNHELLG